MLQKWRSKSRSASLPLSWLWLRRLWRRRVAALESESELEELEEEELDELNDDVDDMLLL